MACDTVQLLEEAKCIQKCIPPGMMPAVNLAVLCNLAGGGGGAFTNLLPSTFTVGGIPAGSTFENQTLQQLFDALLYPYQSPAFSSFTISGVSSPLEVGTSFGPAVTFLWGTSQSGNVAANSVAISEQAVPIVTGSANDGSQAVSLAGAVQLNAAGSYAFGISATNTNAGAFSRALTLSWQWRRYFGTNTSATLTEAQIEALASSGLATSYAGSYAMAAGGYKFICLAHAVGGQITSVKDASTQLSVPMAAGTFTDGGGFGYEKVSVTNALGVTTDVRVYRTSNILGGAITLTVT